MQNEIDEAGIDYTPELKKELDSRLAAYKNGKAKIVTAAESKKRVQHILKSAGNK